jgi:hypothetical protein
MLRVIAPPLHSTPAILQAVRGSWPRGVVSEKKVGDNCFEFKLKGYKCMFFLSRAMHGEFNSVSRVSRRYLRDGFPPAHSLPSLIP